MCILVKDCIVEFTEVIEDTVCESILWIRVKKELYGTEFIIGSTYIQHEGSDYHHEDIFDNISEDIRRYPLI